MVVQNMNTNSANAKKLVKALARELGKERGCQCKEAAKYAVITAPEVRNSETTRKLRAILPDYF
jgi:5'-methylthioadenosine phosphorylase